MGEVNKAQHNDFILEVRVNAEGQKLAYFSKENGEGGMRIAGPKAWGGSKKIAQLKIKHVDLIEFIESYAPEIKDFFQ